MRYLSDIMQEEQTALFEKTGAFFAFSNKQFEEKVQKDVKYYALGAGMYCPQSTTNELVEGLDAIYEKGIKQDIEEHTLRGCVARELANHECYYTGSIQDAVEKLKDYPGATKEYIRTVYREELNKGTYDDW